MRSKLIAASGSLLVGGGLFYMALKGDPTASADTLSIDPLAVVRFEIILAVAAFMVIVSMVLFAMAAMQSGKK